MGHAATHGCQKSVCVLADYLVLTAFALADTLEALTGRLVSSVSRDHGDTMSIRDGELEETFNQ